MAITVVTNVLSINAQRNLQGSGRALAKSLERLSSGLRINRAGDDAAGLAISETLRSQIRGLNQAVRNSNDGISLLSTAEGATSEATSLLQRIRELSVQAASDTNSATNRASIQEEVTQLVSELDRISTTVEFNGTKLLDGTFTSKTLQVGAFAGQTLSISLNSLRTSTLGQVAETTGGVVTAALATAGDLTIDGIDVGTSSSDGVSNASAAGSAIAIATAINTVSGQTGVSAVAQATTRTGTASAVQALAVDGTTDTIVVNGVDIGAVTITANDGDSSLRNAINAVASQSGVLASLNGSNQLVLTAADGRNIDVTTTGGDGSDLGTGEALGLIVDGGATEEDNVTADLTRGTVKLTGDAAFAIDGNNEAFAGLTNTTVGLDATTAISTIDISTQAGANSAITKLDNALRQINRNRAQIGALNNRLESTVNSLQSISENLSASESRIRDADFAAETASLTRSQILQQAGIAILAQANAVPQLALSLLQ